jgi:hypothetical protein
MEQDLKNEFVEHSTHIISSSALDYAPKVSPRCKKSFVTVHFSAEPHVSVRPFSTLHIFIQGQNVIIDWRFAKGEVTNFPSLPPSWLG